MTLRNFGDVGVIGSDEAIFPIIILVEVLLLLLRFPGAAIVKLSRLSKLVGVKNADIYAGAGDRDLSRGESSYCPRLTITSNNVNYKNSIAKMATKLVQLSDVERLSSTVIRILGGNPGRVSATPRLDNPY